MVCRRLINTLCDTALTACMVEDQHQVDLEVIDNVVHELRWQWFEEKNPRTQGDAATAPKKQSPDGNASLMVYRSGQLVEQVEATAFPFVIGRGNANNLVIIDKEVSRRHALIDCIGGIYVLEDLNSRNGLLVNQKPRVRALLRSGDIMTFGEVDVVFYLERQQTAKPITRAATEKTSRSGPIEDDGDTGENADLGASHDDPLLPDTRRLRGLP